MKLLKNLQILTVIVTLFISCQKETIRDEATGNIEFSVSLENALKNFSADSTQPVAAIVTIQDKSGAVIYSNTNLSLSVTEGSCITSSVALKPGEYTLTKFMITDIQGKVLHATPMNYSQVGSNFDDPLPFSFSVVAGVVTRISPKVYKTLGFIPQQFGYTSFNLNQESCFTFLASAYIFNPTSKQLEKTTAHLNITSAKENTTFELAETNNSINLKESGEKYIFTLTKEGFQPWTDTLTETTLLTFFTKPFSIFLEKENEASFSFVTKQQDLNRIAVNLQSNSSDPLVISWGDGCLETADPNAKAVHSYVSQGEHHVRVYGEVKSLVRLGLTQCNILKVDLRQAENLHFIEISRNPDLTQLNVSQLTHLKELMCVESSLENLNMTGCDSLEVLHCSVNKLKTIEITGNKNLKTLFCDRNLLENLDLSSNTGLTNIYLSDNNISNDNAMKILLALYQSVKSNQRNGQLNMSFPLTVESQAIKDDLEKKYGWAVYNN